jgi:hypothetical protein
MPPRRAGFLLASFLIGAACAASTAPTDEGVPLNIDIRASVDQRWDGLRKGGAIAHGKRYLLASVKEVANDVPLLRPVNEFELVRLLRAELGGHGFRETVGQERPEIVLTVNYGRGYLQNPHFDGAMVDESNTGIMTSTVISAKQAMRQREPGFEQKAQKAQFEKLYITVSAWKFPEAKGEKPHLYWRTVMVTDNPDGRDLNLALPAMLTAGARYFDQQIKDAEVTVNTTMPAGTVKLGPLNVIEEAKPKK